MALRLKALQEHRNKLVSDLSKLSATVNVPGYEMTAEDDSKFDAIQGEVARTDAQIKREKDVASLTQEAEQGEEFARRAPELFREAGVRQEDIITDNDRVEAYKGWLAGGKKNKATNEQRAAMAKCGIETGQDLVIPIGNMASASDLQNVWRNGSAADRAALLRGNTRIGAAGLLTTGATAGLTLIPPGSIAGHIERGLLQFGGVRRNATVFRTGDGATFKMPISNDTGNTGELLSEQSSIGSTTDATLGTKTLGAYKFSSKLQKFTAEMLRDSAFDLIAYLGDNIGERFGRVCNTYQTTGTGSSQPQGIVVGAAAGVTAAGASAVTGDELIDLIHAVDPAYWEGAKFMFNAGTSQKLRKLKDGNSAYLWRDNFDLTTIANGFSSTLFGYETVINQDMPAMTTGLKPILFGRLDKFYIREVAEIRVRRLSELYAATDEEAMIAFMAMDSILWDPATNPVKRIIMA